jgi:uncharacterized protein
VRRATPATGARARWAVTLALVAVGLLAAAFAGAKEVPFLSGRVVDEAGLLPPDRAAALEQKLASFEDATGAQVVVLTVASLDGEVLEDYSVRVAETWKLGQEKADNGVLLLVSRDDRKLRIEVGYGLEGALTDLQSGRIIRNAIVPRFKAGDYPGGIDAGVDAILGAIRGEPGAVPEDSAASPSQNLGLGARALMGLIFFVVVGVFSLIALFGKGCQSWFLYVFLMPFYFTFPLAIFGAGGAILGMTWLIAFPILRLFFDRSPRGKRMMRTTPWLSSLSTWAATSSSRGGGGFGGGGGFSGGGGSFGGGGASGSW